MTELGIRNRMQEYEKQLQRIAQLEAQVLALSHDRDRLIKCVLENPARVELVKLMDWYEGDALRFLPNIEQIRKALADTRSFRVLTRQTEE